MLRNKRLRVHAACDSHVLERGGVCLLASGAPVRPVVLTFSDVICSSYSNSVYAAAVLAASVAVWLLLHCCSRWSPTWMAHDSCMFVVSPRAFVLFFCQSSSNFAYAVPWHHIDHEHVSRTCRRFFLPFFGIDVRNTIRFKLIICCVIAFKWHQRLG